MHWYIFNHQPSHCPYGLHYLVLQLLARPFWGFFGEADSPPVRFTPALWCRWHLPIGFLFLQGVFQNLGYFLALASRLFLIWKFTWGICSDLEGPFLFWCLRRFRRSLRSGQRIFLIASARAYISVPSHTFMYIRYWRQIFECLTARPKVLPDSRGFLKFSEGLLRDCEKCPGKFDSCLMLFSSQDEYGFVQMLPFSPTVLLL